MEGRCSSIGLEALDLWVVVDRTAIVFVVVVELGEATFV